MERSIRNRIYDYVLVSKHKEPIDLSAKANRPEPALLLVSRQIRHEARAIYWFDNCFHFTVCQFNHQLLKSFYSRINRIKAQEETNDPPKFILGPAAANVTASLCNCQTCLSSSPTAPGTNIISWKYWLQSVHQAPHDFPYPAAATHIDLEDGGCRTGQKWTRNLAVGAFEVVRSLSGLEWEQVEAILKPQEDLIRAAGMEAPNVMEVVVCFFFVFFVMPAVVVGAWSLARAIAEWVAKLLWRS
ncbi:hypothetical protein Slin15195_G051840 [Septoria linicola]|uniref:Uncharacterized protein n=1 Tax=Septoria linicola TaxID=215465 RepID=A0A9Q9ASQ9_9PEZI|nr:hypothetical protein Slin14017_G127340 [Septoria linicola]USW51865.1 hypothetical protein Slin15195_G051840 [Septoria linicola]